MVCPDDAQFRQRLETLYQRSPTIPLRVRFMGVLNRIQGAIVHELTRDRLAPRIIRVAGPEGHPLWQVYDPSTQERLCFASELEVRIWLENRHLT